MILRHIKEPKDLQTKPSATRDGFLEQALAKTDKSSAHLERARAFLRSLETVTHARDAVQLKEFQIELAGACGLSSKAIQRLTEKELDDLIRTVLEKIEMSAGDQFREEIVFRYLLIKGDALGGSIRNVTGASAGTKLADKIVERLEKLGHEVYVSRSPTGKVQRIAWDDRVLKFDCKPAVIGKNVDLIMLRTPAENDPRKDREFMASRENYIAAGELKGGIDPAGADEHWKTASSALERIRTAFRGARIPEYSLQGQRLRHLWLKRFLFNFRKGAWLTLPTLLTRISLKILLIGLSVYSLRQM